MDDEGYFQIYAITLRKVFYHFSPIFYIYLYFLFFFNDVKRVKTTELNHHDKYFFIALNIPARRGSA